MDCDICGKKAKVHLTQLVGGQIKKIALCDDCAKEKGVTDPTGFALAEMLLGKTPGKVVAPVPPVVQGFGRRCPECGFTLDDLRRIRRFGCAGCYTTFKEEVNQMLRGMHKGSKHCGKVPAGLMELHERTQRLEELRGRLDQAITSENYEEAAGLRDEIRQIEIKTSTRSTERP
ncbi:UvrB/UvrC motif-containing protein [Luteolibacter sp. GHJ8]|uniref:UvrB/UvrC motif-containing protein n=1 Tax=Luteolibacter rhizosphaerae TaxID=2989719 RepID=A0ABT3G9M6_9BACT|nr:UvrB/UvrC motif-containing protein [Luteolibacter rhizosphaerae]MCW1915905.1 UvrB/UvrC motif-containing protein [Luteolibacter rhizosphaerae]